MTEDTTESGPFGRAAHLYRAAGWRGTLPIGRAPGQKSPPPNGWTGHGAPYPSGADTQAWADDPMIRQLNIGLRAEPGTIGLDVDHYGAKTGQSTITQLEEFLGPLPPTWVSSARPAPSGIRWYRVPDHIDGRVINWPGEAGKFVEIIQPGHRYAVVWPSTNPEARGAEYRWWIEQGSGTYRVRSVYEEIPAPGAFPPLPDAWVRNLMLPYDRVDKETLGDAQVAAWWDLLR